MKNTEEPGYDVEWMLRQNPSWSRLEQERKDEEERLRTAAENRAKKFPSVGSRKSA